MAVVEMVTGALVSSFVKKTIDSLSSRYGNIFRARKYRKKQLSILKTKLLAIDVVADDAEQKQFRDSRVRDWLLRAKDVVSDAEDLLNEIDSEFSESQAEANSQNTAKKVWNSLKSSFVSFFEEKEIESRMAQVIKNLEDLVTQKNILGLEKARGVGVGTESGGKLSSTSLPNERVIYGRDDDKDFVLKWLASETDNKPSILSIVGMGGVGKTTLAQHIFNDPMMDEAKFDVKAWVCVSDDFDVFKVSRAILEAFTGSNDDSRDLEMVHRRLKEKLMGQRFLLVLDDLWNEHQLKWEDVQKPLVFGAQGSKILVTTRSKEVASTMRSEEYPLEQLQDYHCWELFSKDIVPALALSYIHLPFHLKTCFAYCALFPKDYKFDKDCLIQLWMSENFIHCHQPSKSPEEVGQHYFNDLLSRSFFQPLSTNKNFFVMHDLLNDLAKYVGGDIYFEWDADKAKEIQKKNSSFVSSIWLQSKF